VVLEVVIYLVFIGDTAALAGELLVLSFYPFIFMSSLTYSCLHVHFKSPPPGTCSGAAVRVFGTRRSQQ
jgi:hypothetical protein